jgi:RNA polymerase sigma-70 factor (ECF subfamily)
VAEDRANSDESVLMALMQGYLDGRIDAFDGLYAALAGRIRGYLLAQCRDATLADDLVQETFMQLHRSRRTYEPGRPVAPWAFAIARHVYLMHRRGTARRLRFEQRMADAITSADVAHDAVQTIADGDRVQRALRDLPADQRRAMLMHHVHGWSFSEIANRLGIRLNAAKTRAFRGVRRMREQLK